VIGPSVHVDGHLRGEEDVYVEGEVTGTVHLPNNTLTIGAQGRLKADVYAHTAYVEGSMEGDLFGSEQVIIRKSARIRGNIASPRVTLEDGATFKGSIEMDPESVKQLLSGAAGAARPAQGSNFARPAPAPAPALADAAQKGSLSR
jgi:cytoskeletal protein CcmA (bactofilin family)